ncbi:MAG TPA: 30S ribosome-binding factor RbfA [Pirellulales bacterium]|jgi:ribosome-binding factor A|nr:30S ribosome-binding factor RbfA [Pirellulales bacterium]
MSSRRLLKAAAAIREVVSMAILAELKDPRIRAVTVTYVEVSPDMRHAKVHVSVMGDETQQKLSVRGLQSAAGFLQSKIAERIDTRFTPRLMFILDQGVKKSIEMAQLLKQVLPPENEDQAAGAPAESAKSEAGSYAADDTNEEPPADQPAPANRRQRPR